MIYIDPSETRSSSKALFLLDAFGDDIQPMEIEGDTGADIMISPNDLPHPATPFLLEKHVKEGSTLAQLKFGHDFVSSVIDGRVKESQSRMKLIGAAPWQRGLLCIGDYESWGPQNELFVDFEPAFNKGGFTYIQFLAAKAMWIKRGGFVEIVKLKDLADWIRVQQAAVNKVKEEPQRIFYPQSPVLYEEELPEFDNEDTAEKEWQAAQNLTMVTDWRNLLNTLPGIADKKIRAIIKYMEDNDKDRNWYNFMELLENGKLTKVAGIGNGIASKIKRYLENKE